MKSAVWRWRGRRLLEPYDVRSISASYCTVLFCTVLYTNMHNRLENVLYCTVLYCTIFVLHCTVDKASMHTLRVAVVTCRDPTVLHSYDAFVFEMFHVERMDMSRKAGRPEVLCSVLCSNVCCVLLHLCTVLYTALYIDVLANTALFCAVFAVE